MDEFRRKILQTAYDECQEQGRHKKDSIAVDDLLAQASYVWAEYRNVHIEEWADRLVAACAPQSLPDSELEELVCQVDAKLVDWNIIWEVPLWEPADDDDRAQIREQQITFVSWGIAGLWWVKLEGTEIAPLLDYTRDEVESWLREKRRAESFLARRKTKSGEMVTQQRMFAV